MLKGKEHVEFIILEEAKAIRDIDIEGLADDDIVLIMRKHVFVELAQDAVIPFFHQVMFLSFARRVHAFAIFKGIFINLVDDVAAEPIDALIQVKAQDFFHLFDQSGIMVIEVWLGFIIKMKIPFI